MNNQGPFVSKTANAAYRAGWEAGFAYRQRGGRGKRPVAFKTPYEWHRSAYELGVAHGCSAAVEYCGKSANIAAPWSASS